MEKPIQNLSIIASNHTYVFRVAVARTQTEHERGLMGCTELRADEGMLFIEERPVAKRMWMKGTNIPLDMVFISQDWTIGRIEHDAEPESERKIWSEGLVVAVLELSGGVCSSLGIARGDRVVADSASRGLQ